MPWRLLRSKLRFQQLHMLLLLERHGSVNHVAELMGLTQPAVTKSLKELEIFVGAPLFARESTGLRSTAYCQPLLRAARESILCMDGALAAIKEMEGGITDRISIGVVGGRALSRVAEAIGELNRLHPELRILLRSTSSENLFPDLSEGRLDLALGPAPSGAFARSRFLIAPLRAEPQMPVIVARRRHPLAGRSDVSVDAMLKFAWVLPPVPDPLRSGMEAVFARLGLHPPRMIEASQSEVVSSLLESEDVLAVVEPSVAEQLGRGISACAIRHRLTLEPLPPLVLVERSGGVQRRALRVVADCILAHFG